MRDFIKKQLQACKHVNITFSDNVYEYTIPQYTKPVFDIGKCYIIRIPQELVNNTTNVLAVNWNNGNAPKYPYLKVYISKALGKMLYVDSVYFDPETRNDLPEMFSGWLDSDTMALVATL